MKEKSSENFDPNQILGVPEGSSSDVVKGAYRAKQRILLNQEHEGQMGRGVLVPENDFEKLKLARKILLENALPEQEAVTAELKETQEMKYQRIANQIILDERQRAIFSYLVNNDFNSNLPVTVEGVAYFYDTFKSESDYQPKLDEIYAKILNDPGADREQRHNNWNEYLQATLKLRKTLFPD